MADANSERLGRETRRHVRIEVHLKATFTISGDEEMTEYPAVTKNIGRGGICLKITEKKGEILGKLGDALPRFKVALDLAEGGNPIDVGTRTTWISCLAAWLLTPTHEDIPILVGMAFHTLEAEDEEKINIFIADLLMQRRESIFKEEKVKLLNEISQIRRN